MNTNSISMFKKEAINIPEKSEKEVIKRYNTLAFRFNDIYEKRKKDREYAELIKKYGGELITRTGGMSTKVCPNISILVWDGGKEIPQDLIPKDVENKFYAVLLNNLFLENEFTHMLFKNEKKDCPDPYFITSLQDMSYSSDTTHNIVLYRSETGDITKDLKPPK